MNVTCRIITRAEQVFVPPARLDSPQPHSLEEEHVMATAYPIVPGVRFKDVAGEPGYCVGDDGSIWCCRRGNGIQPFVMNRYPWRRRKCSATGPMGHFAIKFPQPDGSTRFRKLHHLILEAFVGPRPPGLIGCHFPDPDVTNNNVNNLVWGTHKLNTSHQLIHGTRHLGSKKHGSKLTEDDVIKIREYAADGIGPEEISQIFHVSRANVRQIISRERWKHVG